MASLIQYTNIPCGSSLLPDFSKALNPHIGGTHGVQSGSSSIGNSVLGQTVGFYVDLGMPRSK